MKEYLIRKENWGYIVFYKQQRKYWFFNSKSELESYIFDNNIEDLVEYRNNKIDDTQILSSPLAAYIEISPKCTLSCLHCFKSKYQHYTSTLSFEKMKSIVDELYDMAVFEIRLVGNEAGTSPYFDEITKYIKERGFYCVFNTSAYYSDKKQKAIIDHDFDNYLVSLDGVEATHDSIRGPGAFKRVLSFIDKIYDKSKIRLNVTVSQNNIAEMESLAKLASGLGVSIGFAPFRNIGNGRQAGAIGCLTSDDMKHIQNEVFSLRRKYKNTNIILAYHDIIDDNNIPYHPIMFSIPCPARHNISILNNGQVFHCDFLSYIGDKYCGGNVMESTIREIWIGPFLEKYRTIRINSRCKNCRFYMNRCSGGCASEVLETQDLFYDSLCTLNDQCSDEKYQNNSYYDEDYYIYGVQSGKSNYQDYRWIPELSFGQADVIQKQLSLSKKEVLVDFGAAMGYLVRAFNEIGYNMYGIDLSEYAVSKAEKYKEKLFCDSSLKCLPFEHVDWIISMNTLEHLTINQLHALLSEAQALSAGIFALVPISKYDGGYYISKKSNQDPSHILRRTPKWWELTFSHYFDQVKIFLAKEIFGENVGNGCICIKAK